MAIKKQKKNTNSLHDWYRRFLWLECYITGIMPQAGFELGSNCLSLLEFETCELDHSPIMAGWFLDVIQASFPHLVFY